MQVLQFSFLLSMEAESSSGREKEFVLLLLFQFVIAHISYTKESNIYAKLVSNLFLKPTGLLRLFLTNLLLS